LQECGLRTGFPPEICRALLTVTAGDVSVAWIIAEAGITKVGAAACAKALEAEGVPSHASVPACNWAAENLWDLLFEYLPTRGGPTWYALQTGREDVHWRRCASPDGLRPGEHWLPPDATRNWAIEPRVEGACMPNVAIWQPEDQLPRLVYIPCANMSHVTTRDCVDNDGIKRVTGQAPLRARGDIYMTGFYKKVHSGWPSEFALQPWTPPPEPLTFEIAPPPPPPAWYTSGRTISPATAAGIAFVKPPAPLLLEAPPGSVAVFDEAINQFRILAPT
ncbi:hypothetical protein LCGC14_2998520, partial [marine sediment metagenome]